MSAQPDRTVERDREKGTSRRRSTADLPGWPRLLSRELAAAYVGVSVPFLKVLGAQPIRVRSRILYDRAALDVLADRIAGPVPSSPDEDWTDLLDASDGARR
jgi:hypothetical protein